MSVLLQCSAHGLQLLPLYGMLGSCPSHMVSVDVLKLGVPQCAVDVLKLGVPRCASVYLASDSSHSGNDCMVCFDRCLCHNATLTMP